MSANWPKSFRMLLFFVK